MALVSLSLRPEGAASPKPIANAFAPPPNPNIRSLIQTAEPRVGDLERVGVSLFSAPGSMFLGVDVAIWTDYTNGTPVRKVRGDVIRKRFLRRKGGTM